MNFHSQSTFFIEEIPENGLFVLDEITNLPMCT